MKHYKAMLREVLPAYAETLRKSRNLSQEKMSEKLLITPRAYNNLKQGRFCFSIVPLIGLLLMLSSEEFQSLQVKLQDSMGEVEATHEL